MSRSLSYVFNALIIVLCLPIAWISYTEGSKLLGLKTVPVEVVGTGSMYPSLFWDESQGGPEKSSSEGVAEYRSSPLMYRAYSGLNIFGQTFFKTKFDYGDMVAFSSSQTSAILTKEGKSPTLGFIKRIIGKPGDKIELRDGFVVRNGEKIEEPYLRSPRSTYGGSTLADCQELLIPPGQYFVLGDNRKVSSDSRFELGLVSESDLQYVLPYVKQQIYRALWRDASRDSQLSGKATLNSSEFYQKLTKLKENNLLEKSATLRGSALLKNPKTNLDLAAATQAAGYSNVALGEFVTYGNFSADELYENLLANHETARELNNPNYSDIGVSAINANVNGCPTQVIVGHMGGYVPASYPDGVLESWKSARDSLDEVIPSWQSAVGVEGVDQAKLNELLNLLSIRRNLAQEVVAVIEKREWISKPLQSKIDQDTVNNQRIEELTKSLNSGD